MRRRTILLLGLAAATAAAGGLTWRAFSQDLAATRARTRGRSAVIQTSAGALEYGEAGAGPPALMIHGTGGGFDQGLAFAAPLAARGWRVIAPSRFGYLRTDFPDDPSSERQADVLVELLDALGIERVPVLGGSAGALSAIALAIRHPDRCSALVALVPAAYAPGRPPVRPPNPLAQAIIEHGLRSDLLFWTGIRLNEDAMFAALLATDPVLIHAANAAEQARARAILRDILPVSDRARGLLNDARLSGNPAPMALDKITAPTLAISLADDRFQTLAAAEHIANTVPGAALVRFETGGHIWVGREAEVFNAIDGFLRRVTDIR
jgi:pimeloyl-ACP methyl ester carboxylesterase